MTPAKLLLFGEHTVLHGGEALAVPLRKFGAAWAEVSPAAADLPFVAWAASAKTQPALADWFDAEGFARDAPRLAVRSDIPQNYGLGSSGALAALVYERYASPDREAVPLPLLRERLGELESFFHGRSSGLDPLVCYLDRAVRISVGGSVASVRPHQFTLDNSPGHWFLLDSRQPKAGRDAIARFGESCKDRGFRQNYLIPARATTAAIIRSRDNQAPGHSADIAPRLRHLSELQLEHLAWLVPEHIRATWTTWLQQDLAYLKLCGAGGGGYFLGWTGDRARLAEAPGDNQMLWL